MEFIDIKNKKQPTDKIIDDITNQLQNIKNKYNYDDLKESSYPTATISISNVTEMLKDIKKDIEYLTELLSYPEKLDQKGYWLLNRYSYAVKEHLRK